MFQSARTGEEQVIDRLGVNETCLDNGRIYTILQYLIGALVSLEKVHTGAHDVLELHDVLRKGVHAPIDHVGVVLGVGCRLVVGTLVRPQVLLTAPTAIAFARVTVQVAGGILAHLGRGDTDGRKRHLLVIVLRGDQRDASDMIGGYKDVRTADIFVVLISVPCFSRIEDSDRTFFICINHHGVLPQLG